MPAPNITLLFGPMLIGLVLNTLLYGIMVTQMLKYYRRYPTDPTWIRFFMLYLLVIETAVVVVECGIVYQPLIIQFGTIAAVTKFPVLLPGDSLLIALVSGPVQLFSAWRIKVISRSYVLPVIISILALGSFALGVTTCVRVIVAARFVNFSMLEHTTAAWLITTCVCDIVLAAGMARALLSRKTGFAHVDSQINRIVRLSIESGSITAAVAILDLAFALGFKHRAINFIVDFPLSTLYTCSVLALMNSRQPGERGRSGSRSGDAERGAGRSVNVLSSSGHGSSGTRPPAPMSFALGSMGGSEGNMKYVHAEVYDGRGKAV